MSIFKIMFDGQDQNNVIEDEEEMFATAEQNRELVAALSFEDFTMTVKQMHPDKASGSDGLNPTFF